MANHEIYRSTDGSAPAITNASGSLCAVLDAILVNGYGSKSSLGWSIVATGTNVRLYRAPAGSRMYLGVDETANVYEAKVRGFETQTNAGVGATGGTGLFPTVAQQANALTWQKTNNTAGNRPWVAMGDDKRFFINVQVHASSPFWNLGFFGDIVSLKAGDAYQCLLVGKASAGASEASDFFGQITISIYGATITGHYMPRSYTQIGSSIQVGKTTDSSRIGSNQSGVGSVGQVLNYPSPISGALHLSRFYVYEVNPVYDYRGYIPGVWCVCHAFTSMSGVADGDPFSGSDALNGMTFEIRRITINGTGGAVAFETTPSSAWT